MEKMFIIYFLHSIREHTIHTHTLMHIQIISFCCTKCDAIENNSSQHNVIIYFRIPNIILYNIPLKSSYLPFAMLSLNNTDDLAAYSILCYLWQLQSSLCALSQFNHNQLSLPFLYPIHLYITTTSHSCTVWIQTRYVLSSLCSYITTT